MFVERNDIEFHDEFSIAIPASGEERYVVTENPRFRPFW